MEALNVWGRSQGYGFIKEKLSNYINGAPIRYEVACDRGVHRGLTDAMKAEDKQNVRTDPTDPNKITGLFWTFAWGIEM
ncbi:hypothetical protein B0T21DRAFT_414414 [Apiosordaria backusii]|uniref:Uncharacterized protein n=1 Tax=Apiosordaria backusii TaxID=314023 RepID=A0AA40ASK5_9PEZI|nr:hypothetical protein B0T21DRAFT_414414 [Apiosordaria backusii]